MTPLPRPTRGLMLGVIGFASGGSVYSGLMPQCVEVLGKVVVDLLGPYFLGTLLKLL